MNKNRLRHLILMGASELLFNTAQAGTATLTPSASTLALSINCHPTSSCTSTQNAALTGNPRQITIQNTGSASATNVSVSASTLPEGTRMINTCTGTLHAGDSCLITLIPGSVASSDSSGTPCTSGTQPIASTITITADGDLSTPVNAYVLGYGCQYQGGFLYSVDDNHTNYPKTGSVGGKVIALVDQAAPYIHSGAQATSVYWSANGSDRTHFNASHDIIPFVTEVRTEKANYSAAQTKFNFTYSNTGTFPFPASSAFATCHGEIEGQCNTGNILALYNAYKTQYAIGFYPYTLSEGPTNLSHYAAGSCKVTMNNYSDWYLPAICEIDAINTKATCPNETQSILSNLSFLLGDPGAETPNRSCSPPDGTHCLAGYYWSSTEYSAIPLFGAWYELFSAESNSQNYGIKNLQLGVRCSRALT